MSDQPLALRMDDGAADLALAGGKGASLARLARAGLPVPGGFHLTTAAYRDFVSRDGLDERILAAARGADPAAAAREIAALFAARAVPEPTADAVRAAYAALGPSGSEGPEPVPVAVRSSATAEDLPGMSFAGQQDTYLGIRGEDALLDAVKRCWASLWTERAITYRARNGVASAAVALAVVVQELVDADAAGVLFTADPVSGARDRMVVNAAWGLGEAVVGGLVTADTVVLDRSGAVVEERVGDKTVRTVRAPGGTREEPVPERLRRRPVLDRASAARLGALGARIEELYGTAMDVEWALRDGTPYVLQARPVTALRGPAGHEDPAGPEAASPAGPAGSPVPGTAPAEEWNDTRGGEFLWTNANVGEAIPDVMTPCTWSLVQIFMDEAMSASVVGGHPMVGNIGGRFYMNLSVPVTLATLLGATARLEAMEQVFGKIPDGLDIPRLPVTRWQVIRTVLPNAFRLLRRVRANIKRLPSYTAGAAERTARLRSRAESAPDAAALARLWDAELLPWLVETSRMLQAATRQGEADLLMIRKRLATMVGQADADAMLTGVSTGGELASLGPIVGLGRLARGEIDRDTYARLYGHRGPHEFEVSLPRPGEDPGWIDRQLVGMDATGAEAGDLLDRQEAARTAAWARLRERSPRKERETRRRVARWSAIVRDRETTRSEVVRAFWAIRAYALRAGELTGLGDDVFFLTVQEISAVLRGDAAAAPAEKVAATVAARRAAFDRYSALPPYPRLIVGRFDPVAWAADPRRRGDLYDARGAVPAAESVTGFPGAPGVVEGVARVIAAPEDGDRLGAGEILVTTVTNVGWTPLFPRAAAVVTDIGAPLSHAAIVARELGIPAVVGTGNATMRLRDGDRIRVDGARGTVEPVDPPAGA